MSTEGTSYTIKVTLAVCIVCSILVSFFAVVLKGIQNENKRLDKLKNILAAADLMEEGAKAERVNEIFTENIKPEIIKLEDGKKIPVSSYKEKLAIEKFDDFDFKAFAKNPKFNEQISSDKDIAKIKRMSQYMPVYIVKKADKIEKVIFPIYGSGLWDTMYGFIALDKDLNTVKGFTFYQHGETPGLGGEVDNPLWKALWNDKKIYGDDGTVKIAVVKKGMYDDTNPEHKLHKIDGLAGSTITGRAVDKLVKFWLDEEGYRPFLEKLKKEI